MHALALGLGADVPFFIDGRPALVTGIGERLTPYAGLPAMDVVLVYPGFRPVHGRGLQKPQFGIDKIEKKI
jgi:4-diphosphocytidyl-2-C-methyl-D-erythritol kinase